MIPETGHFALVLALLFALAQAVIPHIGAAKNHAGLMGLAKPLAVGQFLFTAIAFAALMACYVRSDFSVANVAENSHTLKPMIYKISGVWSNHEGSMLLWVLILTLFGAALAVFGGNLPVRLQARALAVQAAVAAGFFLFSLLTSNPFLRLNPVPIEGNGMNPVLQDPGLAIHPPFLYLGYVGFSLAFSLSIAALIEGRVDAAWARWVRPWTLAAWIFLTIGISLGSWWAYYELGWGGFWFWDPVENASFMPWLTGTALLHSAIVVEKRDALKSWTVLLAIVTFSLSLLGTFLVRSGVLSSVHAFANDPARGLFILVFLGLVAGGSLLIYAIRAPQMEAGGLFAPISREGALLFNNLLLATAAATVMLGTLYPLLLDSLTGQKITVGAPYFNTTFAPLMVPLLLAVAVGPALPWKRGDLTGALQRLKWAGLAALLAILIAWYALHGGPVMAFAGIGLAVWVAAATLAGLWDRAGGHWRRLFRLPGAVWGMSLAHFGLAVTLTGIIATTGWQTETLKIMRPGDVAAAGPYRLRFDSAMPGAGPNYTAIRGRFTVMDKNGGTLFALAPEQRSFIAPQMTTSETAIRPTWRGDVYAVIGEAPGDMPDAVAARIYFKPLVYWIWGGGGLMALGGLASLADRRVRIGAPQKSRGLAADTAGQHA